MASSKDRESLLIAYALGELYGAEKEAVERQLRADAEMRRELEEVQGSIETLKLELEAESIMELSADRMAQIDQYIERHPPQKEKVETKTSWPLWLLKPSMGLSILVVGTFAALLYNKSMETEKLGLSNFSDIQGVSEEERPQQEPEFSKNKFGAVAPSDLAEDVAMESAETASPPSAPLPRGSLKEQDAKMQARPKELPRESKKSLKPKRRAKKESSSAYSARNVPAAKSTAGLAGQRALKKGKAKLRPRLEKVEFVGRASGAADKGAASRGGGSSLEAQRSSVAENVRLESEGVDLVAATKNWKIKMTFLTRLPKGKQEEQWYTLEKVKPKLVQCLEANGLQSPVSVIVKLSQSSSTVRPKFPRPLPNAPRICLTDLINSHRIGESSEFVLEISLGQH